MYGGDTAGPGTAIRREFPADAESITLFERENLPASVTNVWAMEIEPSSHYVKCAAANLLTREFPTPIHFGDRKKGGMWR